MSSCSVLAKEQVYQTPDHLKRPRPAVPRTAPAYSYGNNSSFSYSQSESLNSSIFSERKSSISRLALLKVKGALCDVEYTLSEQQQQRSFFEEEQEQSEEEEGILSLSASSSEEEEEESDEDGMPKKRKNLRKSVSPEKDEIIIDSDDEGEADLTMLRAKPREWSEYDDEGYTPFTGLAASDVDESSSDEDGSSGDESEEKNEEGAGKVLDGFMKSINDQDEEEHARRSEDCEERLSKSLQRMSLTKEPTVKHRSFRGTLLDRVRNWKVHPLDQSQMTIVNTALRKRPGTHPDDVIAELSDVSFTSEDAQCLRPGVWLKDPVIGFFSALINNRDRLWQAGKAGSEASSNLERLPHCHMFNSFFYPLMCNSYARVRRWTKNMNVFEYDKILVPVNVNDTHWCLAMVNLRDKQFVFFDSMQGCGSANKAIESLRRWIVEEWNDKKPVGVPRPDLSGWTNVSRPTIPQQRNSHDCGVFVCTFAEYVSRDAPFSFTQDDIDYVRPVILFEIITKRLLSEVE